MTTRRLVLSRSAALVGAASAGLLLPEIVRAQSGKVRVGFMLPYTGTFAQLGVAIENGVRMAINEKGGKLGGREIEWFKVDDESEPSKGVENATRLVQRDKVDVLIGTVHSGVQMGIQKVVRDSGTLCLIPNAGVHAATRALCAPNVFRTSFTNSQPTLALGKAMVDKGHKKAVWITWKYAAGDEAFEGFRDSYTKAGGTIVKELGLPFPNVEFQALLTEIASLKPDAVACFFAGGGAAKFIRDYAAAGLKGKIPLYGSGFLTEGVLMPRAPPPKASSRRCTTATRSTRRATSSSAWNTPRLSACSRTSTRCRATTPACCSRRVPPPSRATSTTRRRSTPPWSRP
jgi:branched-chain amino acid transport system substrate-binding protein